MIFSLSQFLWSSYGVKGDKEELCFSSKGLWLRVLFLFPAILLYSIFPLLFLVATLVLSAGIFLFKATDTDIPIFQCL